ncbi:hypothetical protein [Mucilaginibacter psychrotolerans]|uniref:Biopolymer transporter ExbD n=1 Tax=Mucilaginibacter psychrotolerans TaxID=1524096 RepID=A0A4Y8S5H9_9SPHI|nr:hypothetical protein [Mucilaginibacter psychrotolerans]TFF34239.1 hypothetical protein E2R66_22910 [Mucilaginibacter psychrotolerans]
MARPNYPEPVNINMPASSGLYCDIDGFAEGLILIGQGRVMLTLDKELRRQTLINMAEKHAMQFSPVEMAAFENMEVIGMPLSQLKSYLASYKIESEAYYHQLGIKISIEENELGEWIQSAKQARNSNTGYPLRIALKADRYTDYPLIKRVFDVLQDKHINKFRLITETKSLNQD